MGGALCCSAHLSRSSAARRAPALPIPRSLRRVLALGGAAGASVPKTRCCLSVRRGKTYWWPALRGSHVALSPAPVYPPRRGPSSSPAGAVADSPSASRPLSRAPAPARGRAALQVHLPPPAPQGSRTACRSAWSSSPAHLAPQPRAAPGVRWLSSSFPNPGAGSGLPA